MEKRATGNRSRMGIAWLLGVLLLLLGGKVLAADTFLVLGGHMYGLTPDHKPSPGFQAVVDSLVSYAPDAYIAAGDCTYSGSAAEWDTLAATYAGKWNFPFIPVLGNHDSANMWVWYSRFGDDTWRQDFGSTRVLFLWSSQSPNGNPDQEHLTFILNELALAATDTTVTDLLIVQHHLFFIKNHPRYEIVRQMGNAWYDEFSTRGYDVNNFFDEIWPAIVAVAQVKPVTFYCGDTGYTNLRPGIFYDVLDGVTLAATGYDAKGDVNNDSVVFYRSHNGQVTLDLFSPWGTNLGALQDYDLAYWTARLSHSPGPAPGFNLGKSPLETTRIEGGAFEMGDHIDPRYGTYADSTGYSVQLSPFELSVNEITVQRYLEFLNSVPTNTYLGYPCVDLNDAQCQIQFTGTSYVAKDSTFLQQPMVEVSWYGALAYCNWLSTRDGLTPAYQGATWDRAANGWRLPTDAEFEFALRGGFGDQPNHPVYSRFWTGNDSEDFVHQFANYYGTGDIDVWTGLAPVGSFPPNLYGLRDIAGNAFEWTFDPWTWGRDLSGQVTDPVGPGTPGYTQYRVIRGGGYNFDWAGCRSGYRSGEIATESESYIGFRIAKAPSNTPTGTGVVRLVPGPRLAAPSPNPFNPRTRLRYELPTGVTRASLVIYDARGRRVRRLKEGDGWAPQGSVVWDGRDDAGREIASGTYLAVLRTERGQSTRKLALIR